MHNHQLISKKWGDNSPRKRKKKNEEDDAEEEEEEEKNCLITREDNHIYFYDDINTKNILLLIKYIKELNIKLILLKTELDYKYDSSIDFYIYLHINSHGGYIMDGFAAIDYIKKSRIPIISIVDGYAASAATFLSIVCHKRQITSYSSMLIHQLSSGISGTFQQIDDDHKNNLYLQNKIKKLYLDHSNIKLTNKLLTAILKQDIIWDANKCKYYGLVDEIV